MATYFYARYVPPVNVEVEYSPLDRPGNLVEPSKSKKRKRVVLEKTKPPRAINEPIELKEKNSGASPSPKKKAVTKKRKEKTNGVTQPPTITIHKPLSHDTGIAEKGTDYESETREARESKARGDGDIEVEARDRRLEQETKHTKILSKFERSSKIAGKQLEKLKSNRGDDNAVGDEAIKLVEKHGLVPLPQPAEVPIGPGSNISALPDWLAHPVTISTRDTVLFETLSLSSSTAKLLASNGYNRTLAIQSAVLPLLLPGPRRCFGDLCISAATGSGKTLAYVLPMVESLCGRPTTMIRGLIVVPTRELVTQVRETLQLCSAGSGLKIGTAVGSRSLKEERELLIQKGQDYDPKEYQVIRHQQANAKADLMDWNENEEDFNCLADFTMKYTSRVDILICTPGRLVEHLKSTKGFTLNEVQWLVIDEADRLLDQSFQEWVEIVLPALQQQHETDSRIKLMHELFHISRIREVQKIVLSATMTQDIGKLVALNLSRPTLIHLASQAAVPEIGNIPSTATLLLTSPTTMELPSTLNEISVPVSSIEEKPLYLLHILASGNHISGLSQGQKLASKAGPITKEMQPISTSSEDDSSSSGSSSSSPSNPSSGADSESDSGSDSDKSTSKQPTPQNPTLLASTDVVTNGFLVFTNNNENALRLARLLGLLRPSWAPQIGSLTKSTGTSSGRKTLAAFRTGKISILIASDRASRGLDIQNLAHVINYDMPGSLTAYVHRIGRTARAGKEGTATTLVAHHEARWFWNEIARSQKIRRAKKVSRMDWQSDFVSDADRTAYAVALKRLGQESRGEIL